MAEDPQVAQARQLLKALDAQICDISERLDSLAQRRGRSPHYDPRPQRALRALLDEAHRHVDGIHRRFPETRPERAGSSSRHRAPGDRAAAM